MDCSMDREVRTETVCSPAEIEVEIAEKRRRMQRMMAEQGLDAVVIARHENIAWVTAGVVDVRVGMLRETGAASVLITKDGDSYYVTTNNEARRLDEEEFKTLGYRAIARPWTTGDPRASIDAAIGKGNLGSDVPMPDTTPINLQSLRFELTGAETTRYRWLGEKIASVATRVLLQVRPGMTEKLIQASLAERLISLDILPSVYLCAVDERALDFRHPVPRGGVLKRLGMVGFCARRWGLSASITRFVHFGPMASELKEKFRVVAGVNARLQAATVTGASAETLFEVARAEFALAGFIGEETMHHQGGATGYLEREWVARPGGHERVTQTQAFAWNANLPGAKVEDTTLLADGKVHLLTGTPELPTIHTDFDGVKTVSAGVLMG